MEISMGGGIVIFLFLAGIIFWIKDKYYYEGRASGWYDCEESIVLRAKKNKEYDHKVIYKDLIE